MATLVTLVSFDGSDGQLPVGDLLIEANGDLFGTTSGGSVFELVNNGDGTYTPQTLASLTGEPFGSLIADANGDLFGTTTTDAANGDGTVFELVNNGDGTYTQQTLASFDGTDGTFPFGSLIADANDDLFGTTSSGGANGDGTVFELVNNGDGTYTPHTLASFDGSNGQSPGGSLIADASGDLFGTTAGRRCERRWHGVRARQQRRRRLHAQHAGQLRRQPTGKPQAAALILDAAGDLFGTTRQRRCERRRHGVRAGKQRRRHLHASHDSGQLRRQQTGKAQAAA